MFNINKELFNLIRSEINVQISEEIIPGFIERYKSRKLVE